MPPTRTWGHCSMCPDDVWKPSEEFVRLPKPIKVHGYITFYLCRDHARKLVRIAKQKNKKKV